MLHKDYDQKSLVEKKNLYSCVSRVWRQDELIGDIRKVALTLTLTLGPSLVLRRQFEEQEVGVRGPSACEDVSPEIEGRPLLEYVTKQRSEDSDWFVNCSHKFLC
jgi:hypothetical protein